MNGEYFMLIGLSIASIVQSMLIRSLTNEIFSLRLFVIKTVTSTEPWDGCSNNSTNDTSSFLDPDGGMTVDTSFEQEGKS